MGFRIGVVGATGATGQITLALLRERRFPVDELRLFASRRSAGRKIVWADGEVEVEALEDGRFDGLDVVLNATSASLAREWVPRMVEAGAIVSDKSSAYRLDPDVRSSCGRSTAQRHPATRGSSRARTARRRSR
jgi:aspartate-semialdehyde dehydrogenase